MDLLKLKALAEAATPEPWKGVEPDYRYDPVHGSEPFLDINFDGGKYKKATYADLEFIAAANPETVLKMIARIERLEKVAEEAECTQEGNEWDSDLYKSLKDLEAE